MSKSPTERLSSQERIIVLTLAAINFTHIMDAMIMMPLGDIFMNIFAIDPQQFSLLVSAYASGAFISSLLAVFYLDVFDRRRGLIFLYAGFVVGTFLCGLAPSYYWLLTIRFITGLFGGVIGAMALSIVSDVFRFERRGKAMGYLMAGFSAAAALGVPLGLFLADQFSWKMPFFTVAGMGAVLLGLIIWKFPSLTGHLESVDKVRSFRNVLGAIFLDRNQVNALVLGFRIGHGTFSHYPFYRAVHVAQCRIQPIGDHIYLLPWRSCNGFQFSTVWKIHRSVRSDARLHHTDGAVVYPCYLDHPYAPVAGLGCIDRHDLLFCHRKWPHDTSANADHSRGHTADPWKFYECEVGPSAAGDRPCLGNQRVHCYFRGRRIPRSL